MASKKKPVQVQLPTEPMEPIAPRLSFGDSSFQLEATRSLEQARQWPLAPGSPVWVGVRRIRAWYRSENTLPLRRVARFTAFAIRISSPCIPLLSAALSSASQIK